MIRFLRDHPIVVFTVLLATAAVFVAVALAETGLATSTSKGPASRPASADRTYRTEILGAAPFRAPFADDSFHDHVSIESNPADRANWQPRFDGPGGEDIYEPTDLTFTRA